MNKIVRKTLDRIEKIKPALYGKGSKSILETIERIENAITINYQKDQIMHMIDCWDTIELLLFDICRLDEREVGFVLDKIMKYNFSVNDQDDNLLIRYEVFEDKGINEYEADRMLQDYYNEKLDDEEKDLIENILISQEKDNQSIKDGYKVIESFSKKRNHSKLEYDKLSLALRTIYMPARLIQAYKVYFEAKEKDEVLDTPITTESTKKIDNENKDVKIPSKRELKNRLNQLYHPESLDEYFDMKDFEEVLTIVKQLSISDERVKIILNDLYRCAIRNDRYYEHIINKLEYTEKRKEKMKEIAEIKEMLLDDEIKDEANQLLEDLYGHEMITSFDYEAKIYQKL